MTPADATKVWILSQYGVPLVTYTDQDQARAEFGYLSYHGDGYTISVTDLVSQAPPYTRLD